MTTTMTDISVEVLGPILLNFKDDTKLEFWSL